MVNKLTINKATFNRISFHWNVGCHIKEIITSEPFWLTGDSHPICFALIFDSVDTMGMKIYSSCNGRAIVKIISRSSTNKKIMTFIENWGNGVVFNNLITTSMFSFDMNFDCDITWLGCASDEELKSSYLPRQLLPVNVPFDNHENPDFYVIVDNKKLPAHKAILAHQSEVLRAMFNTPMKESKDNEVTMKEIEYSTMEIVLKIMYTGVADVLNDVEMALKVLQASEMYQMLAIKRACEAKLLFNIQDDNVLRLLDEATKHNSSNLCYTCVEYITARNEKIISHDKLRELAHDKPAVKTAMIDLWFSFAKILTFETRS